MKHLLAVNANQFAAFAPDGSLVPQVEVILVMTEPEYILQNKPDGESTELLKLTETFHCRFVAGPVALLKAAQTLIDLATEANAILEKARSQSPDPQVSSSSPKSP